MFTKKEKQKANSNEPNKRAPFFQAKLNVGKPSDKYEVEADKMADKVVNNEGTSNNAVQKKEGEEEVQQKPLASEISPLIQKMETSEEEPVQKMEEEEPVQKMEEEESVQKMEEEEPVQKMEEEPVQKMEEEEVQQKEEEEVQAKSTDNKKKSPSIEGKLRNGSGGTKMDNQTKNQMESGFGADFSQVNIHNDNEAAQMSQDIGAQAFTHGNDVYFNKGKYNPNSKEGKHLLAHELTHTVQQKGMVQKKGAINISKQPLNIIQQKALSKVEKRAAIANGRTTFNQMSVRIIQKIVGVGIDGDLGPLTVAGISNWQTALGIADNGIINVASLDALVTARNTSQTRRHEAIRLVADYHNLDLTANTLTVYASKNAVSNTRFETGLRVIEIGTNFFASSTALKNEINTQLATVDPNAIMGPIALAPIVLNATKVRNAISYNNNKFNDSRSIFSFQHHLGMMPTGTVDENFVQGIANLQNTTVSLADVDGKIGLQTIRHFFVALRDLGNHNAVINMIIDFYNMPHTDMVTALYFEDDAAFTDNAATTINLHGPTRIRVRRGLYQSFEGAVHTIRHELEHVRQNIAGISSVPLMEFLGESIEIMSVGMPHERLFNQNHNTTNSAGTNFRTVDGLRDDAGRLWNNWSNMTVVEKRANWSKFVQVRNRIKSRVAGNYAPTSTQDKADWTAASAAQKASWNTLLANFNGQARP